MITPVRVSYAVLAATIVLAGILHLGVPLLVVLFSYFALRQLYSFTRRKWLALALFIIAVVGIGGAGVYFTRAAILALPDVADTSIPSASAWAQKRQIDLPFSDFESLRQVVIGTLGEEANYLRNVANVAKATTTNLVFSILGIVAAASLFFKTGLDPHRGTHRVKNNLYSIRAGYCQLGRAFCRVRCPQRTRGFTQHKRSKIAAGRSQGTVWSVSLR